ncbi:hypothetical protein ABII15_09970 [Streptomyces sp. HUAS MG91]|uniref:Uncharacterized protein n=1 Tax=Streptomyces tabacisoli TaxID=3156398 RepID=A0AAU8IPH0_9ACTN
MTDDFGFLRASEEDLAARAALADRTVSALRRAGLPAWREGVDEPATSGAVVRTEPDAELASAAVSVSWRASDDVLDAAVEALAAGRPGAPEVRRPGLDGLRMRSTLIEVLIRAGLLVTPDNDTMNPDHVLVFGHTDDLPPALRPTFVRPRH